LANLAGALSSFGMNNPAGEAFSNRHGLILDIFRFSDPARRLEYNPEEVPDLVQLIGARSSRKGKRRQAAGVPSPRRRPAAAARYAVVEFTGDASARATLMEIVAEDARDCCTTWRKAITGRGCNIEVVLINTEAHKALDVFYLTSNGSKLTPAKQRDLRERLLSALQT
jgi:[protein-PII] uridylyltransferase